MNDIEKLYLHRILPNEIAIKMQEKIPGTSPVIFQWVNDVFNAKARTEDILGTLIKTGWHQELSEKILNISINWRLDKAPLNEFIKINTEYTKTNPNIPYIDTSSKKTILDLDDRKVKIALEIQHPRIVLIEDFLSEEECDLLIEEAKSKLKRSTVVSDNKKGSMINDVRTSSGMFYTRGQTKTVHTVEKRLAKLSNWPIENGEGIQILNYKVGAEYKPHYDYFSPTHPKTQEIVSNGGNRVGTFVLYLDTPEEGGGTIFPNIGALVYPHKGSAVFFSYDVPDPISYSLHGGDPVLKGEKWIATKWLRERKYINNGEVVNPTY